MNMNFSELNSAERIQKSVEKSFSSLTENRASKMVQRSSTGTYLIAGQEDPNLEPQFPELKETNFGIQPIPALVMNPAAPHMAIPVPDAPGVPNLYLTNTSSNAIIGKPVGNDYYIYTNQMCYDLVKEAITFALPSNFLQTITIEEDFERNGGFTAIHIDFEDYKFEISNGNYKTELNFGVTIKHNVNEAILYSAYARDNETNNKINLGAISSTDMYHAGNADPKKVKRHLVNWATKGFPHRVEQLRQAMRSKVMEQQIKLVLGTGKMISPQQQEKIFKHIMEVEVPEMGQTTYAIMSGLASWASDEENFPVKNAKTADNVGETMVKRQSVIARIVMCKAMFGRDFEGYLNA